MKAIDIIYKQLTHALVLTIEIVRQLLNEAFESAAIKQNKRVFIMQQFVHILSWVQEFNP